MVIKANLTHETHLRGLLSKKVYCKLLGVEQCRPNIPTPSQYVIKEVA